MIGSCSSLPSGHHHNRIIYAIGYLTFVVVSVRDLTFRAGSATFLAACVLLAGIVLLMATDPLVFRRFPGYRNVYFVLQTAFIQALGLLPPHEDVWAVLYILVAVQAIYYLPLWTAAVWGALASLLLTVTLWFTAGGMYGLGLGLTYAAGSVLVVSWELLSSQAERARRASDDLLAELRDANERLAAYVAQAEAHAAARERELISRQLHDSVSQTIFGITLAAESARLLLDRDPSAVPKLLDHLQDQTSHALSQMRSLISEWRPK